MWYVIHARDCKDNLARRSRARPEHLQRLRELQASGRLLTAGPLPAIDAEDPGPAGFSGSLIIARFDSLEQARIWMQADPFVTGGVYSDYEIHPFKQVMPE